MSASATPFVAPGSIVRRIWGDGDTVLVVFAGAAAEFALSRAVHWLFFTGALPADPIGRLFSTARFARDIVFADEQAASRTLERIREIHHAVERQRGERIPAWAHRHVLSMLIDYSERAYSLLHRPLAADEREELYAVFRRVGAALGVSDLPSTYDTWCVERAGALRRDLAASAESAELYRRYRRHLGWWRYRLLLQVQTLLVPELVREMLRLRRPVWARPAVALYRALTRLGARPLLRRLLVPWRHLADVRELDLHPAAEQAGDRPNA